MSAGSGTSGIAGISRDEEKVADAASCSARRCSAWASSSAKNASFSAISSGLAGPTCTPIAALTCSQVAVS